MKRILYLVLLISFFLTFFSALEGRSQNNVGIGTTSPNPNAVLELVSPGNNQGLLVPKLTTSQRTAGSFVSNLSASENGLLVFDSNELQFYYWNNPNWVPVSAGIEVGTGLAFDVNGDLVNTGDLSELNEIQDLQITGNQLQISDNPAATVIDLSGYLDNTDSQVASAVPVTAQNGITSVNVQAALEELQGEIASAGGGDMLESIYDTNGDGTVNTADDATTVSGLTVQTAVPAGAVFTDAQDLTLTGNTLSLTGDATTVDLTGFVNTDNQDLELTGNILSLTNDATTVDLSSYLDNTDAQDLTLTGNTLSLTGDGTTVDLSAFLDNTDTQLTEAEVDAFVANNGFLTSEVDGDITNEIQDLTLTGNTLSLTGDATTVDLTGFANTDNQDLNLTGNTLSLTNDATTVDLSSYLDNTDAQDLDLTGNTLSLTNDATTVDLSAFLDNTDTQLTEAEVDAFVANNGFLTSEIDGDITNEIQDLTLTGNTLSLTGDVTTVDLTGFANTDNQDLDLTGNTLSLTNDATTVDLSSYLDNTDAQDLTLTGNTLSLTNDATTVDLSSYLDNTDAQDLTLTGNTLSLTGDATTVDLTGFANTDNQDLDLSGNTLSLTNDATTVDLSSFLDNTDAQDLTLTGNTLSLTGDGTTVDLSSFLDNTDTQLTEAEVDAFVANNGFLTSEVDGDIANEIQDLTLTGNTLSLTGDATTVDLTGFANTDNQDLDLTGNTLSLTNDASTVDLSSYLDNTDAQDLTLTGNTLSLTGDATTVDLTGFANTDNQDLELTGNTLSLTNDASTVDLSGYLDNTDAQDLTLTGNSLSLTGDGTTVDLSVFLDNTDTQLTEAEVDAFVANNGFLTSEVDGDITNEIQDLTLTGNTLSLTGDGTTVDLSAFLDNTDTQLTEAEVDAFVANNGFLISEVDGDITNEIQDLTLTGNTLSLTGDATTVDLSAFLDNTNTQLTEAEVDAFVANNGFLTSEVDADITNEIQDLILTGSTLSLTGDATTVDLSAFLDNTDTQLTEAEVDAFVANNGFLTSEVDGDITNEIQDLTLTGNTLSLTGDATTVDLTGFANTDNQDLELTGNTLSLTNDATTVDLSSYLDNTDAQDLTLTGNTLSLTGDGTTVDLSSFLDNTDTQLTEAEVDAFVANNGFLTSEVDGDITNEIQDLTLTGNTLSLTGDATTVDLAGFANTDNQDLDLTGNTLSLTNDATTVDLSSYLDNTDAQDLTLTGNTLSLTGDATTVDLTGFANTDNQDLELTGNTLSLTNDASTVDLSGYLDNTDAQDLTLTGNTLSLTGDGTTVDLSAFLDNTDTQLTEAEVDAFVANNGFLTSEIDGDITNEIQDLTLTGNTLSLTGDATTVDLTVFANTDNQDLELTGNTLSLTNDASTVDLSGYLDNTDAQDLTLTGNTLSLTGDGTTVDLSSFLDNTDTQLTEAEVDAFVANNGFLTSEVDGDITNEIQDLTLTGSTLSLTGDATTVDLSTYLDNTDAQDLTLTGNTLSLTGDGTTVDLSSFLDNTDTQLTEAEVDAFVANNGFLTSELDGDNTNEIQDLTLTGNTLSLTGDATTVDLTGFANTDNQDLDLTGNTLSLTNDATPVDLSSYLDNTDAQDLTLTGNTLLLTNDVSTVDLSGYLDNTDAQDLALTGNTLSLTGDATTVDLSSFLDNTDTQLTEAEVDAFVANNGFLTSEVDGDITNEIQDLTLTGNTLSLTGDATTVDLTGFANTDNQDLNLTGNTLSLTNDATTVDLSSYLDNTDAQDLTLTGNTLSLTGDATTVDLSAFLDNTDTQLTEAEVDAFVANNGFLTTEVDGDNTNEIQDLTLTGNTLSLTGDGTTVDLSSFLDNTDTQLTEAEVDAFVANNGFLTSEVDGDITNEIQDLTLTGNTLSLTGDGTTVDLTGFANTDNQDLELTGNTLSLTNDASTVDLSSYLDNTDAQDLTLTGNTLSLTGDATTVDLTGFANTDNQDLELTGNTLSLTNDATTVDLSGYLDNTDAQDLTLTGNTLSLTGDGTTVDLSGFTSGFDLPSTQVLNDAGTLFNLTNNGDGRVATFTRNSTADDVALYAASANNGGAAYFQKTGDNASPVLRIQDDTQGGAAIEANTGIVIGNLGPDVQGGIRFNAGTFEGNVDGTPGGWQAFGQAGGEVNTASNTGAGGIGVFRTKTGANLEFRNINAGSSAITLTDDSANGEIDIDIDQAQLSIANTQVTGLGSAALLDVGTVAGNVISLDGLARLPAVDGSQLTNLPSSPWTGATDISYSGGNVGIGTTSVFNVLSIKDNIAPGASFDQGVFIDLHNDSGIADYMTGLRFKVNSVDTDERFNAAIFHRSTGSGLELNFAIQPNNAVNVSTADIAMTITQAARVGIGTTAPSTLLELQTASGTQPTLEIETTSASGEASMRFVGTGNTFSAGVDSDGSFQISDGTTVGSGNGLEITSVGIFNFNNAPATIGSANFLFNQATTSFGGMYMNTSSGGEPFYGYAANGTALGFHYVDGNDANKWKLSLNSGVRMTVETDGDVGIGTTTPSARLDVAGTTELNGDVTITGDIVTPPPTTATTIFGTSGSPTTLNASRSVIKIRATSADRWIGGITAGVDGQKLTIICVNSGETNPINFLRSTAPTGSGTDIYTGVGLSVSRFDAVNLIYVAELGGWVVTSVQDNTAVIF